MATELHIHIPDPPTSLLIGTKKVYCTSQCFYSGIHPQVRMKVVDTCKRHLWPYFVHAPKFARLRVHLVICHGPAERWDLDNKAYFWNKVAMDLLKSMGKIPDDSIKYVDELRYGHRVESAAALEFKFTGDLL
jgi:hypothetical protein